MIYLFTLMSSLICFCFELCGENYPQKFEGNFENWKKKQLELISLFLPDNPVILEAGAYEGNETLNFAFFWPLSQILSFEPNPNPFQILQARTSKFKNIKVHNRALNNYSGIAPFYICYGSTGTDPSFQHASSLLEPSQSMMIHYQGPIINVGCVVLDEWCQQNEIDHVDLLSLDLQGSELQVLKSSPRILSTVTCIKVHTNFFPFRVGTTQYFELREFLENKGFKLLAHWYREGLEGDAIFIKNEFYFNNKTNEFLQTHEITPEKYSRFYEPFFKVYYDLDDEADSIKNTLKKGLAYEGNIGVIIDQIARRDSLAIDIGSHIGVHTVTMSRKVGPKGAVIAFEPNKKLYMELLHTLSINDCSNVIPISKALSDTSKTVLLNNIRIEEAGMLEKNRDLIEAISLDSLNLSNVSIIKMDVENYEYFVLKGGKEIILRNKPVIIFECWIGKDYEKSDPAEKANFNRVISLIESYGYEIYVIYSNDFIAFPKNGNKDLEKYKANFQKLDLNNFDLGIKS